MSQNTSIHKRSSSPVDFSRTSVALQVQDLKHSKRRDLIAKIRNMGQKLQLFTQESSHISAELLVSLVVLLVSEHCHIFHELFLPYLLTLAQPQRDMP